ncbi:MAG: hypothetical protein ACREFQ_10445, partial [Stellaceae bacterium]
HTVTTATHHVTYRLAPPTFVNITTFPGSSTSTSGYGCLARDAVKGAAPDILPCDPNDLVTHP